MQFKALIGEDALRILCCAEQERRAGLCQAAKNAEREILSACCALEKRASAAQQTAQQLTPAGFGRRGMRSLFAGLVNGLLHKQHLRADGVGHGRLFAVGAVRLQYARLDRVVLHGIQNVVQPCAHFGRVNGTGDFH